MDVWQTIENQKEEMRWDREEMKEVDGMAWDGSGYPGNSEYPNPDPDPPNP